MHVVIIVSKRMRVSRVVYCIQVIENNEIFKSNTGRICFFATPQRGVTISIASYENSVTPSLSFVNRFLQGASPSREPGWR